MTWHTKLRGDCRVRRFSRALNDFKRAQRSRGQFSLPATSRFTATTRRVVLRGSDPGERIHG
jgi:hypothetical protein